MEGNEEGQTRDHSRMCSLAKEPLTPLASHRRYATGRLWHAPTILGLAAIIRLPPITGLQPPDPREGKATGVDAADVTNLLRPDVGIGDAVRATGDDGGIALRCV